MSVEARAEKPGARRRWHRRLALLVGLPLATLAGLELGFRGLLALRGDGYDASAALARVRQLGDVEQRALIAPELAPEDGQPAEGRDPTEFIPHPFLGFAPRGKTRQLDGELRRQRSAGPEAVFEVLLLGGSVAGQFHKNGTPRLFDRMREDSRFAGRELHCAAFSTGGYKQPQQSIRLLELLHMGYRPDLVLEIDGFNEIAVSTANATAGTNPYYPSIAHWSHLVQGGLGDPRLLDAVIEVEEVRRELARAARRIEALGLHRSAVLGRIGLARLESLRAEEVRRMEAYQALVRSGGEEDVLRGPDYPRDGGGRLREIVTTWEEASRSMHDICAARGIPYVHVLQPALHDAGSKPLAGKELEIAAQGAERFAAVRDGYPLLREAGERLRARGVRFVDGSSVFAAEEGERYFDPCHFDPRGCRLLAELIAPAVLASLAE